jgi:ribosome-associated toxin RatA of RatAB toxin-antitoxin module
VALESIEREHVIRGAAPREAYDVVTDYACYPRVFPEFTKVTVVQRDGARQRVEFIAKVVIEVRYVLDIVHDEEQLKTSWTFVEGKIVSDSVGGWQFTARGPDTHIKYRAGIAVNAPLPKFVLNKVSDGILRVSIPRLFSSLEREVTARRSYKK